MIAYNKKTLSNRFIIQEAAEANAHGYITADTLTNIVAAHPVALYTPNLFVRIGMGFLTIIIILLSLGLLALIFQVNSLLSGFVILFGFICYGVLELLVAKRKYYNAGVDNVLMAAAALFVTMGISFNHVADNPATNDIIISLATCLITAWLALRFTDAFMGTIAILSLFSFVFYLYAYTIPSAEHSFSFILILLAAALYLAIKKLQETPGNIVYHEVYMTLKIVSFLTFYVMGNYYVVSELSFEIFQREHNLPAGTAWFYWLWTFVIPLAYIAYGIHKQHVILLRIGVLLFAIAILTFRNYYAWVSTETALLVAGIFLIVASYWLMNILKEAKAGFIFAPLARRENGNLEALIMCEAIGVKEQPADETKFGGGNFGGAGAGSNF